VIDHLEGKPSAVYEELCRQRMSGQDASIAVKIGGGRKTSKQSSTSSWPDESLLQSSNLDISTGHVLLEFLREHLDKPGEISNQWKSLADYVNRFGQLAAANEEMNKEKNFDWSILPYDDSAVTLQSPSSSGDGSHYINASKIYDSDPQQAVYIATQGPLENTAVDFWQMVWEQGVALVVNLANSGDYKKYERLVKYWPEESSKVYGTYEVGIVPLSTATVSRC
jgi:receptor-type tyrosine-protein phosphatase N